MKLYFSLLIWNVVLVMAMVSEWMNPLYRVATILISVVAISGIAFRDHRQELAYSPAHKKEKVNA